MLAFSGGGDRRGTVNSARQTQISAGMLTSFLIKLVRGPLKLSQSTATCSSLVNCFWEGVARTGTVSDNTRVKGSSRSLS